MGDAIDADSCGSSALDASIVPDLPEIGDGSSFLTSCDFPTRSSLLVLLSRATSLPFLPPFGLYQILLRRFFRALALHFPHLFFSGCFRSLSTRADRSQMIHGRLCFENAAYVARRQIVPHLRLLCFDQSRNRRDAAGSYIGLGKYFPPPQPL